MQEDPNRGWAALPVPCLRVLASHLHASRCLFAVSVTCRGLARIGDHLATDLSGVAAPDLHRALTRFDRATSVSVDLPEDFDSDAGFAPPDQHYRRLARALARAPPPAAARVERLRVRGYPGAAAALAAAAPRWRGLRRVELVGCGGADWDDAGRMAAALPALQHLAIRDVAAARPRRAAPDPRGFARLESLELSGFAAPAARLLSAQLPQLPGLQRLVVAEMPGLESLSLGGFPGLRDLAISNAPALATLPGLAALTSLTSLALDACPAAARSGAEPMAALAALTRLRELRVTGCPALHRLPAAVAALTELTSLEAALRLRPASPASPRVARDFAALGGAVGGGGGDGGDGDDEGGGGALLQCLGLRRLVVRGFGGALVLPEGMERLTALQDLDLHGSQGQPEAPAPPGGPQAAYTGATQGGGSGQGLQS